MQKFIVPQFIDVENKILGPITVRQFATVAIGAGFMFLAYKLADFSLFLILAAIIGGITALIAFVKFNGHPFHIFLLNIVSTYKKPMLRVWLKDEPKIEKKEKKQKKDKDEFIFIPKKAIASEKLSELALIIDTGGVYKGEAEANRINQALYHEK